MVTKDLISTQQVLLNAIGLTVLCVVLLAVVQFALLYHGAIVLERAATAGAREAALPKASYQSVAAVIQQRLVDQRWGKHLAPPTVLINGRPTVSRYQVTSGDRIDVKLRVDMLAMTADLLRPIGLSCADQQLEAVAHRRVP